MTTLYWALRNKRTGKLRTTLQNGSNMPALYANEQAVRLVLKRAAFYNDRPTDYEVVSVMLQVKDFADRVEDDPEETPWSIV